MSGADYFAFGSNLNQPDFARWCRDNGHPETLLGAAQVAVLPGFELAFDYASPVRRGGALNVRPAPGRVVVGVVYRVAEGAWAALDEKEGAPIRYRRHHVTVLTEGRCRRAVTYRVTPEHQVRYAAPTNHYVAVVESGMRLHGLGDYALLMLGAAASGAATPPAPAALLQ